MRFAFLLVSALGFMPATLLGVIPPRILQDADTTSVQADTLEAAQDTVDTDDDPIRPYDEVITDAAVTDEGLFTVHRIDEDLFFEIPMNQMERELLLQTRITRSAAGAGFGGERETMAVVRFERRGDRVLLRLAGHENVAPDTLPIFEAVESSNFEPILYSFDIETIPADSTALVIDVTDFFTSDTPVIGPRQDRREEFGLRAMSRDRTFIDSARSYPENIEVRRTVTFSAADPPSQEVGGALSMQMGHSFLILPESPMDPRPWDERVGYFSVRQNDYGTDAQRLVERRFIRRWRLVPSDPGTYARGELVEPVEPIVFYIDPATPEQWRPYLKQGVEDWQAAFESAGFRNAILARDPPTAEEDPDFDSSDVRYSVIRYLASPVQNASGPSFFDPRSGEILGTHIQWHHNVMNLVRNWYFVQTAAANPEARGVEFDDEVMGRLIRYVAAHEVGHTLGLPHNMKGHSAVPVDSLRTRWVCENGTSTSIMDYARFNYVAQPGDDTCFIPVIGPYDHWAIEWGYRWIPEAETLDAEVEVLREWIMEKADDPRFRFGDPSGTDPGSTREALGDDPVRASDYGVANLQRIVPRLREWTFEEGESYDQLEELYNGVIGQWDRYVGHVLLTVGGVDWTRRAQGQDGRPFSPVPRDRQRSALDYLDRQVFQTPAWMIDEDILYRIQGSGVQDRIRDLQVSALTQLLGIGRMKRLSEQRTLHGEAAYGLDEMLADLRDSVWRELESDAPVDAFRRNLQRGWVDRMEELLESGEAQASDIAPLARGELREVRGFASRAITSVPDRITRLHLEDLVARIDDVLDGET